MNVLLIPIINLKANLYRLLLQQLFNAMAKKKISNTDNKNYKTKDVEEILKRKRLQNKMFEEMLKNATDEIYSESKSDKSKRINKK